MSRNDLESIMVRHKVSLSFDAHRFEWRAYKDNWSAAEFGATPYQAMEALMERKASEGMARMGFTMSQRVEK